MKNYLLLATLFFSFHLSAQETIISKTELTEVKLYQSGAYVSRSAKVALSAGSNEIVFSGLSPEIDPSSITVKGSGNAVLQHISYKQDYLKDKIKPNDIITLEAQLDSFTFQHNKLLNRTAVLKEEENLLLANKSIGGANSGVMADKLEQMVTLYSKKLIEIKDGILENSLKEKKLKDRMDKIKSELASRNSSSNRPEGNIVVKVNAATRSTATFEMSYYIQSNATWTGLYDIRSKDVKSKVEIIYKAAIVQNTGEDWVNAKFRLSTGNPTAGTQKPELYPWYLNFNAPQYRKTSTGSNNAPQRQEMQSAGKSIQMDEQDAATPMKWTAVEQTESQLSSEFVITSPYTILSNGEEYQIDIQQHTLPAQYSYVAIPKRDADAFLLAKITGWEALSLTPGQANIFFDDGYVGQSYINSLETGDTLSVSLGRDKRINIKREKMKDFSGSKLFGNNKERSFSYEISIRNTRKEAININLEDQIPVSQDKEIEVKADELSGGRLDDQTGKVIWQLELPPNETRKIKFGFTVKYPKDKKIYGI